MVRVISLWILASLPCFSQVGVQMPILYQQPSAANPTPINLTGLNLWMDAYQGSLNATNQSNANPANGDALKTWTDISGNNFHGFAQVATAPLWKTGGGPSGTNTFVQFNGTSGQALTNRCGTGTFSQPNSIILIWNWQPGGGAYWNTYSNQFTQINLASGAIHMFANGADQTTTVPLNSGVWTIDTFIFNGASSLWRHNGTNGPALAGNPGTGNNPGYTLGNFFNYSSTGPMNIIGVVWASTSDTTAIHLDVENYYARLLGIAGYNF